MAIFIGGRDGLNIEMTDKRGRLTANARGTKVKPNYNEIHTARRRVCDALNISEGDFLDAKARQVHIAGGIATLLHGRPNKGVPIDGGDDDVGEDDDREGGPLPKTIRVHFPKYPKK